MSMRKSWLTTHTHVRRIVYGACILAAIAACVYMFGPDRVAGWIEGAAHSAGFNITEGAEK